MGIATIMLAYLDQHMPSLYVDAWHSVNKNNNGQVKNILYEFMRKKGRDNGGRRYGMWNSQKVDREGDKIWSVKTKQNKKIKLKLKKKEHSQYCTIITTMVS